jgi:alanine racemase
MENEMEELINLIKEYNLYIEGVYTHFASADDDDEYVKKQMALFKQKLYYLSENNINYDMVHYSNSAAALLQKIDLKTDYVRAGIASYGLQPSNIKKSEGLKPVLSVKSVLAKTFLLKEGETVGYGRTYKCDKETTCGIVPLGYADGYFRAFSNKAYVLVKGKKCSVIGRVSMDQLVIDITNSGAKFLDEVVLLGKQGNENISCEYLAELANTINYEITSLISKRVKRIYVKGDEVYEGRVCIEGCYSENYFSRTTR